MQYSDFTSQIEQFEIYEAFHELKGEFNFLKPQFFFQPYADLEMSHVEESYPENTAQIGLRLITNFYDRDILCMEFTSESRCILDYTEPSNEGEVFLEVTQKAIESHSKMFSEELKKVGFLHSTFSTVNEAEKKRILQTLIDHFRNQF